jgi:hypothetical protein
MERKVNIQDWQKVTVEDFNNFGLFPRSSFDHIVVDTLIPSMAFTGFTTVQTAPAVVTVGNGRLYHNGLVFYNDNEGGSSLDLLSVLPVVTRRYVGVVVWGQEVETDTEPRTFLTDPVTRATVARVVSTENRRWANISTVVGAEGPDPQHPSIASNTLAVAWILLDSTGIVSIEMSDENYAPNLLDLDARMNENDAWRSRTSSRLDTLATDIAALAIRINGTATMRFVMKVCADVARLKEKTGLPDNYTSWGADHFLTDDESDILHVDYMAQVEEGIRFPFEQQRDTQFALLNPLDPAVTNQSNFILPVYDQVTRLEVLGNDSELSISQYQFQTISWELCTKTRTRIRWGTAFYVCQNGAWWFAPSGNDWMTSSATERGAGYWGGFSVNTDLIYDPVRNILTRGNETFQILDVQDNPGHTILRLVQFWVDEIVDSYYWRQIVTIEGLQGSVVSQTFLNSQGGWLTSVDMFFTRKAASGDVHCLICECNAAGAPNYERTIGRSTLPADLLRITPNGTRFEFLPTYLAKGGRYAVVLQTAGNHFISLVHNNKFAQGSMFTSTDGAWSMGDMTKDFAFRLQFARFRSNRVYAQLAPLELGGGIAEIDLNYDSTRPPGTTITYEVQVNGEWKALSHYHQGNPLNALPPLLPFRALLSGTTDEMPGFGVASNSRSLTSRRRSDYRHISTARTMPTPVNTVYVDVRLEAWRGPPYHTAIVRLLTGAGYVNVRTPSLIEDEIDPDDPTTLIRRCTWNLAALGGAAISAYKVRIEGTTDNKLTGYLVGERIDIGVFI